MSHDRRLRLTSRELTSARLEISHIFDYVEELANVLELTLRDIDRFKDGVTSTDAQVIGARRRAARLLASGEETSFAAALRSEARQRSDT